MITPAKFCLRLIFFRPQCRPCEMTIGIPIVSYFDSVNMMNNLHVAEYSRIPVFPYSHIPAFPLFQSLPDEAPFQALKLKTWGHEGKPSVSEPFGGCWAMWLIFRNFALKPSLRTQSLLGTFWSLNQRSSRSSPLARFSGTSEPGPMVLAAHQGQVSTYTTPLWSLHASLKRGKISKTGRKDGT